MPTDYDTDTVTQLADRLYKEAGGIATAYCVCAALVGVVGGGIAAVTIFGGSLTEITLGGLLGALLGTIIGYAAGFEKSFRLRLEAQIALCQMRIELNTRRAEIPAAPRAGPRAKAA